MIAITPSLVLSVAYTLTELLKLGVTWKDILDKVDETGRLDDTVRERIAIEQREWEAEWEAKRAVGEPV